MLVYQRVFVGKLEKSPHHENQALQQCDILRDSECMGFGHFWVPINRGVKNDDWVMGWTLSDGYWTLSSLIHFVFWGFVMGQVLVVWQAAVADNPLLESLCVGYKTSRVAMWMWCTFLSLWESLHIRATMIKQTCLSEAEISAVIGGSLLLAFFFGGHYTRFLWKQRRRKSNGLKPYFPPWKCMKMPYNIGGQPPFWSSNFSDASNCNWDTWHGTTVVDQPFARRQFSRWLLLSVPWRVECAESGVKILDGFIVNVNPGWD